MKKIFVSTAAVAFLAATSIASAQTTVTPTPGQPGPSTGSNQGTSSNNDPNNAAATRNTTGSGMQQGSGAAPAGPTNMTGPQTTPAEKAPERNNPSTSPEKKGQAIQ